MYSFEGNYRSQPNVSLGGRSEQSRLKKDLLLKNSREARQRRQETRRRNESILVVQSCTRSYLVRKKLKLQYRVEFDELVAKEGNTPDGISHITRLFCSFYNSNEDAKRLEHISKLLLNESRRGENFISIFLLSQVLHVSSKRLMECPGDNTSLRMLDTLTRSEIITRICRPDDTTKSHVMLWKRLCVAGFFECMLATFNQRVPTQLERDDVTVTSPQHQLADSLVTILKRPIYLVGMLQRQNTNSQQVETWMKCIMREFIEQIIARPLYRTTYNYLYPSLSSSDEFPFDYFLSIYKQLIEEELLIKTVYNLASFIRLIKPYFGRLSQPVICLQVVDCLITCAGGDVDDDGDSDDEEVMMMDTIPSHSIANFDQMISHEEIRDDVMKTINCDVFIHDIVKRYMISSQQALVSITNISFHLLSHLNIRVHTCRFLYELSYSNKFLKHLWVSLVNTSSSKSSASSSKLNKLSTVRILLDGSTSSTSTQYRQLVTRLVVFTCLFSNNLHSLHDIDFYSSLPHGGTKYQFDEVYGAVMTSQSANEFELGDDIINIVKTLRDVCLHLIKILFPTQHISPFDGVIDVREVFQRISEGRSLPRHHNTSSASAWDHRHCALAFKCCSRVLSHLHTRYTREHYGNDVTMWFPTHDVIADGSKWQSSPQLYSIQQQRSSNENENLATHMANLSDEDLRMTSSNARQLIVLTMMPYVVPFDTRVNIFTTMLRQDRQQFTTLHDHMVYEGADGQQTRRPTVINITCRRNFLYADAFNDLSLENAPDFRKPLRVQFINQAGAEEAGYGQGVTRAFIMQLVKSAFEPRLGLFKTTTTDSQIYPNPHANRHHPDSYKHFHFLGRVLGKVLYDGMRVELPLASFFLCKLLRHHNGDVDINHLRSLDPDYYRNLMFLRSCDDVTSLNLNFVVIDEHLGETRTVELVEGGQSIAVTNSNYLRYIHLLANYKLNIEIRSACDAFRDGLSSVVSLQWLRMFDHEELQTLISGAPVPIDIDDLRTNAAYSGGYTAQHPVIETFWKVLSEFSEEEKKKFLLFVTSCSRPPLLGFKEMEPAFCIHNGGADFNRLPTSSTCLNLLRLPQYNDEESMKEKLIYCIDSGSGFELS